jgi:hypothetical protein
MTPVSGYIRLINEVGEEVTYLQWRGKADRYRIITMWLGLYGKGFNKCAIQISFREGKRFLKELEKINLPE